MPPIDWLIPTVLAAWVGYVFGWRRGYTEWRRRYRVDALRDMRSAGQ